jgi:ribosome-binding factor A
MLRVLSRRLCRGYTPVAVPRLFKDRAVTQQQRRTAQDVHEALVQTLASGTLVDRKLENGFAIHIIDVQVSPNSAMARVLWEPMDDTRTDIPQLQHALTRRLGLLRSRVASYMNRKRAIELEFIPRVAVQMSRTQQRFREALGHIEGERSADRRSRPPHNPGARKDG